GVYRINTATLEASGIPASEIVGSTIKIFNMGRQVPLYVSTENIFGAGDYIEFFGYKNRSELDQYLFRAPALDMLNPDFSMYTDENSYFLTFDNIDPPLRVTTLLNDITNPPSQEGYYLHNEKLTYNAELIDPYFQRDGGAVSYSSYFPGEGFAKAPENSSTTQIPALNRFLAGPDAQLHLRFSTTNNGNHVYVVLFNDQLLDTIRLVDQQISDRTFTIPTSWLADDNQLKVTTVNPISRHALVNIELIYPHLPVISSGSSASIIVPGQADAQYYILSGLSLQGQPPVIYSYDGKYRMIASTDISDNILFKWPATLENLRLELNEPGAGIHLISSLGEKTFTDFSSDDTEYIIISHPDLMQIGTGSEYVQYRSSTEGGGYKAKAYSILDIYDQFGYGVDKHPQAIRNFVEFFDKQWPSAEMIYVVGRGIEYNKSRLPGGPWEPVFFVPTFGRPGSDNLLAGTLWELVPRFPIGRIAITSPSALHIYLEKVKEHDAVRFADQTIEDKAWIKNVIHIGGGKTAFEQQDFKEVLNSLGEKLEQSDFGANVYYFQKESTDFIGESQSKQIEKLLNEGSTIINYLGHSSANTFEFTINDPSEWNNKGRYPVFSAMGCSAGQIHGITPSLSDGYVQIANEGTIAFISGSGSQYSAALESWARPWYDYFGEIEYGSTLGASVLNGLKGIRIYVSPTTNAFNIYRFLLEQQTFQGDPALRLHPFPGPDYLVDRASVSITPNVLDTKQDSFDLSFSVVNIGRNPGQNVGYSIELKFANGEIRELKRDSFFADRYDSNVNVTLPLDIDKKPGIYRLMITVDPQQLVTELPAPQAEDNNQLIDNLGVTGIEFVVVDNVISAAYPPDFAIVNETAPQLIATSSNAFIKRQDVVIELDTNALFNSPLLVREKFLKHQGTLKWSPHGSLIPDQVYFWRVSTDSISPVPGYIWSTRSFLYKPGSPNGWNQSHFHQFTDNGLEQLLPDSSNYSFKFASKATNFRILNRYHDAAASELPFGFIDGIFYTEFFTKFNLNNVHVFVVAVNPVTGEFMTNPNPGLYGSFNNLAYDTRCFPFPTDLPEGRQNLINFIENIVPDNFLVFLYTYQRPAHPSYFPELWASDEVTFGKSIFSVVESYYPTSEIRQLETTGSKPYIVFFQKNKGGIEEVIAADTSEAISLSYDIPQSLASGTFISNLVGPSSKWYSIQSNF
ncbi:MAG TPA: C25 family cysteine peptidase, partial [Saprospiraceae bacterium]|nr:C25 family cysteine peptidase [Saprospiraceae bacterium]